MRWWSELKYVVKKLNRRRALSGGGAVRGAARAWQRRFGDGGQSRMVGIRKVGRIIAGPPLRRANVDEEARLYISRRADARAGDRREHGDFQFGEHRLVAPPADCATGAGRDAQQRHARTGVLSVVGLGRVQGLSRP